VCINCLMFNQSLGQSVHFVCFFSEKRKGHKMFVLFLSELVLNVFPSITVKSNGQLLKIF
jgi:hypothetical protein